MKAGVSRKDVTPPACTALADHTRYSEGIHDPLFVRPLVLDDGENAVAIVCLDLCAGDIAFCDEIRERIRERTGIEHTLINFAQTHSAPIVGACDDIKPYEKEWMTKLKGTILEAVEEAFANRMPVSLHAGRAPVQIGFNRRLADENGVVGMAVNEEDVVVPWVNVLQARTEDGVTLAVLFEHAVHPVIVHGASKLTGADFYGFAVQRIEESLGEGVTAMFAQGCCANINGYPLKGGWDKAEEAGRKLGDAVLEALRESREIETDRLEVRSTRITLPCQELPSIEQWREACKRLRIFDLQTYRDKTELLERIRDSIQRGVQPELPFEINTVMLGSEWLLVTLQHELFCEYELWVDEHAPFDHTMVFGDTNGMVTYVATDRALELGEKGGYEAGGFPCLWSHNVMVLHTGLAVGIEGMIKEGITSLWG